MTREEAIEVYNGLINTKIKEAFEFFAPELRESEDERMIKAIEHILYENYSDAAVIEGVEIAEIVTWLEKLKEPIDPFDTKLFQDGVKEGRRLEREDMKKEQKPLSAEETELNSIAFLEQLGYTCVPPKAEQKPAEWSDEDELFLGVCKNALSKYERSDKWDASIISKWLESRLKSSRPQPAGWSKVDKNRLEEAIEVVEANGCWVKSDDAVKQVSDFLKSLPERFNLQPKQEWSEDKFPKDIEKDATQFCFDKGFNITPYQAKTIARHFYELGLNARKEK